MAGLISLFLLSRPAARQTLFGAKLRKILAVNAVGLASGARRTLGVWRVDCRLANGSWYNWNNQAEF
jgi:hypothetical protein